MRLCVVEIKKAHEIAEKALPSERAIIATAEDMAEGLPGAIRNAQVAQLFRLARTHYARVPCLLDLHKAWENHMRPKADAPAPKDAPRLPAPPELCNSEAQMRKLAAVRTVLAERGQMGLACQSRGKTVVAELYPPQARNLADQLEPEEWMIPLLEQDPSRGEVEAMVKASTPSSIAFYKRRLDIYPCWGQWLAHYGF